MVTVDVYTTTGTWICPDYVSTVWVRCWAGGASGGGVTLNPGSGATCCGSGGAGGSFADKVAYPVTPGSGYTVTVGAQKTGATGNGSAGNDSWFGSSATVLAKGGAAGGAAPITIGASTVGGAGSSTGCVGDHIFAGGSGGNGFFNSTTTTGPGGGAGGTGAAGGNGTGTSGGGGGSSNGGGGTGDGAIGRTTAGIGITGNFYGGGGGGAFGTNASHSFAGGSGSAGRVEIEYTPSLTSAGDGIRAVVNQPLSTASPPSTILGITPSSGFDTFLLVGNTDGTDGLWLYNGAGSAMTAVVDAVDTYRDVIEGSRAGVRVYVSSDAFEDATAPLVTDPVDIMSCNTLYIHPDNSNRVGGLAVTKPSAYVIRSPNVSSGGAWVVRHGLNSLLVNVTIVEDNSTFDFQTVGPSDWQVVRTDANTVTVTVPHLVGLWEYRIIVMRAVL